MAQTVGHDARPPRHRSGRRPAWSPAGGSAPLGWLALGTSGAGLVGLGAVLTATHAWTAWYTALVFGLWFLAMLAWADAFQTRLPWQVSLVVGLLCLVGATVLPATTAPPTDAPSYAVAALGAVGIGLTLGPVAGAVGRGLGRLRGR
ncbi:hypothetical protein GCM10023221_27130 [Luteimicrobium xylanilyticum]|uniref:Uncharacterized protein n=1 Tax=Luteimicrobium xylanilyticum TaxID=1133546 RepID=A0A5P9QEL9_9MICO|nr:hypothetical protein [Luteimicrobium xylanilyticum]QFU99837.1 hypothetical protein KDY119_03373 [Luteimicrobium xylanilyticum]